VLGPMVCAQCTMREGVRSSLRKRILRRLETGVALKGFCREICEGDEWATVASALIVSVGPPPTPGISLDRWRACRDESAARIPSADNTACAAGVAIASADPLDFRDRPRRGVYSSQGHSKPPAHCNSIL